MDEGELRRRVGRLKAELLARGPLAETGGEMVLVRKAAEWARSEDPDRLVALTGVSLVEVRRLVSAIRFLKTLPVESGPEGGEP